MWLIYLNDFFLFKNKFFQSLVPPESLPECTQERIAEISLSKPLVRSTAVSTNFRRYLGYSLEISRQMAVCIHVCDLPVYW